MRRCADAPIPALSEYMHDPSGVAYQVGSLNVGKKAGGLSLIVLACAALAGCFGSKVSDGGRDGAVDSAAFDAGAGAEGGACESLKSGRMSCHNVNASGQQCFSARGTSGLPQCAQADPGSCPSAGLIGCCVLCAVDDSGSLALEADCFYGSPEAGPPVCSQLALGAYWQTTPP
jgi:hypothetical protein